MSEPMPIGHYSSRVVARIRAQRRRVHLIADRQWRTEWALLPALMIDTDWERVEIFLLFVDLRLGLRWRRS